MTVTDMPTIPILSVPMYAGPLADVVDIVAMRCRNTDEKTTGIYGLF